MAIKKKKRKKENWGGNLSFHRLRLTERQSSDSVSRLLWAVSCGCACTVLAELASGFHLLLASLAVTLLTVGGSVT